MTPQPQNLLGVVGGLGPLASAEFLKTLYELNLGECEQEAPQVLLYSDPSFPDRTETLLAGAHEVLLERLTRALERLRDAGAGRTVICCVTLHHLLPRVPDGLRRRVWSLIDVIHEQVIESRRRHLVLCTTGTRRLEILQNHERWKAAEPLLVWPDERDQNLIHDMIYRVKRQQDVSELAPLVGTLLVKYGVGSFVAGCTEIHLLAKHFARRHGRHPAGDCIDPLTTIAMTVLKESKCHT